MPLIKDGAVVQDQWIHAPNLDEVRQAPRPIVPLALWQAHKKEFLSRNGPIGVCLEGGDAPDDLAPDLGHLELVALAFQKFTDGRAYSSARILRDHLGFTGEIRAVGDVQPDQLAFMRRCGIDSFEIAGEADLTHLTRCLAAITMTYQPASRGPYPISSLRRHRLPHRRPSSEQRSTCAAHWAY